MLFLGVRNMMGGDSPQTVVESPRLTPQPSQLSPPLLSSGIHQVKYFYNITKHLIFSMKCYYY